LQYPPWSPQGMANTVSTMPWRSLCQVQQVQQVQVRSLWSHVQSESSADSCSPRTWSC
jgi:hypothetical protein